MLIILLTKAVNYIPLINISFIKKEIFSKNINLSSWIIDFKQNIYLQLLILDYLKTMKNIIQMYVYK